MSDERTKELEQLLTDWRRANIQLRKEVEEARAGLVTAEARIVTLETALRYASFNLKEGAIWAAAAIATALDGGRASRGRR
jgi:hypothetical protein